MSMNIVGTRNLRRVLEQKAEALSDKSFLIFDDGVATVRRFTYGEFDSAVNRTANGLLRLGVSKGDKVNFHLAHSPELLLGWFAAAKIGAVMVPTNPSSPPDELAHPVDQSESVVSVTQPGLLPAVQAIRARCPHLREVVVTESDDAPEGVISFDDLIGDQSDDLAPIPLAPLDDLAIMYTSGTTSRPKGTLLTHANYVFKGEVVSKTLRMGPEDLHLIALPLIHANAQYHLMATLSVGAGAVITPRFSASRFMEQASRHGCTVATLFAAPIRMILAQDRSPEDGHNDLRLVTFAQRLFQEEMDEWHERFGASLVQIYGMTETIGMVAANPLDDTRNNMTVGRPVLGYRLSIVDEDGSEVPPGVTGHLVVHGEPGRDYMKGYYKDPEATAAVIKGGRLWTGDLMETTEDGYLRFVDRAKDMIKRGGENVAPAEVEAVIARHPSVAESAVIGVPDPVRDESIKAFVVLKEGHEATEQEIVEFCEARLSGFRVPQYVEFRERLPRTVVGKVQRYRLRR